MVLRYHGLSRHDLTRFAPGPGWLDWEHQPDPFRRYAGAELLALPHLPRDAGPPYEDAYRIGCRPPAPLDRAALARLFLDSLALSAWKELAGSRWALRVNPSSGNLHPTEAYLLCGPVPDLCDTPLVAHYAPREHALEVRARPSAELWARLREGFGGGLGEGSLLIGFASIHWREAWKYGERAYRYCQHDLGHALACVSLAAGALGWRARLLDAPASADLARLLGLDRAADYDPQDAEREEADCLLALVPEDAAAAREGLGEAPAPEGALAARRELLDAWAALDWRGQANPLSAERLEWRGIEAVAEACAKPAGDGGDLEAWRPPALDPPPSLLGEEGGCASFAALASGRRSAVALDGRTELSRAGFERMLRSTVPARGRRPFDALTWRPRIHLAVFVHRVRDVEPGLLLLARDGAALPALEAELGPGLTREPEPWAPPGLSLLRLARGDLRATARGLACHQEIAADGCFALAMLAELEPGLAELGPCIYPRLHWEAGAVGQVLYLEAEAAGLRATGIGCFFDEETHRALGLASRRFVDLYHFTVGGPLEDARLTSLPAYPPP